MRAKAQQLGIDLPVPSNASTSNADAQSVLAVPAPKYGPGEPVSLSTIAAYACNADAHIKPKMPVRVLTSK